MRDLETIERELRARRDELSQIRGTETEVYSRIVGYYRSLKNWNKGKREEFRHRQTFDIGESLEAAPQEGPKPVLPAMEAVDLRPLSNRAPVNDGAADPSERGNGVRPHLYRYYYRTTCPNCRMMKAAMDRLGLEAEAVNVDEAAGFSLAAEEIISTTPHLLAYDKRGNELWRTGDPRQVEPLFMNSREQGLAATAIASPVPVELSEKAG